MAATTSKEPAKVAKRPFAVFDIDGTLIRWQLFHAIVHTLGKHGFLPKDAHERIKVARMQWKMRTHDDGFRRYERVLIQEYDAALRQMPVQGYEKVVQAVFDEYKNQTFTYTRDLIRRLKADGYVLLAISGSQQEVIQKLAAYHGFDAAVGATLEQIDGVFSGAIDTPVFDKAAVLQRLVREHNLTYAGSFGVGDSKSDVPMLELVDNAIVFNPDKELFELASGRRWDIVVERKNMVYSLTPQKNGRYELT
jgi:HAD superfamily hydrolase (TIGR01490 family)